MSVANQVETVEREVRATEIQRRRLLPRAALVGLLSGLIAVAFRGVLIWGDSLRDIVIRSAHSLGALGFPIPVLFGAFFGWAGVFLVQRLAPEASGSGIPHLAAVLHRWKGLLPMRVLPVKFVGGALAITGGLTLGREGPTVQMGGAIGQLIGHWTKATRRERAILIAAGAGAGLAAAFNAPLAGMMFVIEEVHRDFRRGSFFATATACFIGDVISRSLVGPFPAFRVANLPSPPAASLPYFLLMGLVAGLFGVIYNRSLLGTLELFAGCRRWRPGMTGALVGALVGAVGYFNAGLLGGGHDLAESVLAGKVALQVLPWFFLARFVLMMGSYGSGAAGGIFAPLLVLGAQIGLGCGLLVQHAVPGLADPAAFAVVGMAAYFTAIVRAPLTGIVLIAEMTGGYALMLPLLAATLAAYTVAEAFNEKPIYEALLERSLDAKQRQQLHAAG